MSERVVIVGAGQGGLQVAASLRQDGFAGTITLIGDEPGLPYQRPPLSKAYMKDGEDSRLALKPASFFETAAVDYRPQTIVAGIDRQAGEVVLDGGARLGFDHLVLATGARNLRPPLPGLDLPGVHELRGLADAARLRDAVAGARRAAVIGGGFIGLEFAAVAAAAGLQVTVIEAADRLMSRAVTPPISQRFLDFHWDAGVEVRLSSLGRGITGTTQAEGVELADGSTVPADLVLLAVGVRPNSELAAEAGLPVANGIVVDGHLRTGDPRIFAVGDCASFPLNGIATRLESVQAAADHARHVARTITGADQPPYDALPWFWSDQGPLKLQIAGLSTGWDDTHVLTDASGAVDTSFVFRAGRLIAVETVNQAGRHMAARKLLAGAPLMRDELAVADWDLRAVLTARG
ncbi:MULTISPECIES: NAD(P)/FAD-dependent oxidoreductase [unclassified Paracoccus (in: a-proteobacteria)]|uniref:NAD(P)/FAD-dependent oxidoreductase n=1 Tax=unclassified Paracoccus (in: a-proteobacteria) TaxID=2688777 RepID=UPI0016005FDE|nr:MULTISPECIES: FAD-dependent oxidoreductase [unclassified Paracoccus (in: a-proteobacteria)]MBB1492569.1 FAD-dependent oxidoreductase [Paracoccus sp. MC1854]MBB1498392.1 FAD-dependent oxidoreductase [Paracoccus sp. MC1862]QQO44400.1 FAD-dependent oxidoreductase [Paracoccus sp. MC1862]